MNIYNTRGIADTLRLLSSNFYLIVHYILHFYLQHSINLYYIRHYIFQEHIQNTHLHYTTIGIKILILLE